MTAHKENKIYAAAILAGVILLALGALLFMLNDDALKSSAPWNLAMFAVLGIIVVYGIVTAVMVWKKKEKHETDYYALFTLGITFLPLGLVLKNYGFFIMSLVLMGIGLKNKNKWNKKEWKDLSKDEKRMKLAAVTILGILVLMGLIGYFLMIGGTNLF